MERQSHDISKIVREQGAYTHGHANTSFDFLWSISSEALLGKLLRPSAKPLYPLALILHNSTVTQLTASDA